MRMLRSSGDVATHWCGGQPVEVYGAGFSGALDCCFERVGLCPGRGPSGRRPTRSSTRREWSQVEVLFERVAGLDIGKASVTVCLRTPGPGGRRLGETRTFKT